MKKTVLSVVLAIGVLFTTMVVYAAPNVVGPDNTGDIDVEIHLGFDPTTGGPTPPNPDMWLAVEIPTAVLIFSDGTATPAHSEFAVVNHTIRNFSARGVRVNVANFTPETALASFSPITVLNINSGVNSHNLITAGTFSSISSPTAWELMTLPASANGATIYTSAAFNFSGTIDASALGTTATQADATLTLRLQPINPDTGLPY